jgi:hypothetical protein
VDAFLSRFGRSFGSLRLAPPDRGENYLGKHGSAINYALYKSWPLGNWGNRLLIFSLSFPLAKHLDMVRVTQRYPEGLCHAWRDSPESTSPPPFEGQWS